MDGPKELTRAEGQAGTTKVFALEAHLQSILETVPDAMRRCCNCLMTDSSFTPASPIWLAGSILIIICALAGALIPAAISLLQTKEIARGWVVTTISFCLLFAVGSLNLLPVDSDLGAFDVFAIINGDSTTKQSSIAQAAQNALELPV